MKSPAVAQNGLDLLIVFNHSRLWQFTTHNVVGQVGQQLQIRHFSQQIKGEQQVVGKPISMGFQQHREIHLLGQSLPALDQLYGLRQAARTDVGLQREMVAIVARSNVEHRAQILHGTREGLALNLQTMGFRRPVKTFGRLWQPKMVRNTVKTGSGYFLQLCVHGQIAQPPMILHRPQRLKHHKFAHIIPLVPV
ncbi:hypothetical protein TU78_09275 [Pseudomonas taetrolens]|uniref:Uncharacterized protein n=1 Tax=Pseudomonas taetrolens TaxID=47884 RepID=A0A0J6GUZ3_PSETA|nr:hypothetical protein TU78_09275 [Pseudomonas taetrolens]